MIDAEKNKHGLKGVLAAGIVIAAVSLASGGLINGKGLSAAGTGEKPEGAALYGSTQESAAADSTSEMAAEAATGALSHEWAAVTEPDPDETVAPAAYSKIMEDGEYVSEILSPLGGEGSMHKELILINPWHLLPENYEVELESVEYGHMMDECAAWHLREMLEDCRAEGLSPLICSSYRDRSKQERLFENDVRRFMYRGMSEEEAIAETARNVAVPGSSEHEAGLAVDIVYLYHQSLDDSQEENDTQQWLMEHCREYGFILRYPRDKQDITGITYEPWHYRYVGLEAAEEIMGRGICLEEYLGVIDGVSKESGDSEEYEETEE